MSFTNAAHIPLSGENQPMNEIIPPASTNPVAKFATSTTPDTSAASPQKVKLTPSAIVRYLDQYVVGQEEAKRALAVVVYGHYKKRTADPTTVTSTIELGKSNILLIGPTGSGKTLLCQTLSRAIDVPFVTADATSLAQTKYVNEEIESMLQRLLNHCDGDIAKAERGIVFIDEIDKLKSREGQANATSGESVQHALLKIMEGSLVKLSTGQSIDTTNILFICGGAFVGIEQVVANSKAYGFISLTDASSQLILDRLNSRIKPTDLITFGLIPEFTGRLPVVATLQPLTRTMLVRIMTEPRNSLYNQFREVVRREGAELTIEPRVFEEIASLAAEYKVGARSLRGIFEEMLAPVLFQLPDRSDVKRVAIHSLFQDAVLTSA
jgi:ATP-dependent Clp protease ATP-binding subunit ClpX